MADNFNSYLYENATLLTTVPKTLLNMGNSPRDLLLGAGGNAAGVRYMEGSLDDVRFYNRDLNGTEVTDLIA